MRDKLLTWGVPIIAQQLTNPASIHEDVGYVVLILLYLFLCFLLPDYFFNIPNISTNVFKYFKEIFLRKPLLKPLSLVLDFSTVIPLIRDIQLETH